MNVMREIAPFRLGVYTSAEAARLLNFADDQKAINSAQIIRWLRGYISIQDGEEVWQKPLWKTDYKEIEPRIFELSFRDLIELRFAKAFIDAGISVRTMRKAIAKAAEFLGSERPLSSRRFMTDGKAIFIKEIEENEEERLMNLFSDQYAFSKIITPFLRDIEFDVSMPVRWWLDDNKIIKTDPQISFGRPVTKSHIPTATLAQAVVAERSANKVAKIYEVSLQEVNAAVRFEQRFAA